MTMKKYNILAILLVALTTACSSWLDVKPTNEMDEEDLFNSGNGYRSALNGIYKGMSSTSLFGRELTWGFADVVAQYYYRGNLGSSSQPYNRAVRYLYDDQNLTPVFSSIWSKGYNVIANCNNLIQNVAQADTTLFTEKELERDMIHGEALACRAFMHMELMRWFAPSHAADDGKTYMPYFDEFPALIKSYLTFDELVNKIETDLLDAREILATIDTVGEMRDLLITEVRYEGGTSTGTAPSEIFFNYRGFRLNYTAVTAALARLYFWAGRLDDAYEMATEVIDFKDSDGSNVFNFTSTSEYATKTKRYDGLIFALSSRHLTEEFAKYDETEDSECHLGMDYDDWTMLASEDSGDRRVSENGGLVRALSDWESYMTLTRIYLEDVSISDINQRMIPAIRLSEMYYIRGEYYASQGLYDQAMAELETVSSAAGCTPGRLGTPANLDEWHERVLQDARKEFWGEGQLFLFYKAFNVLPDEDAIFVLPLPDNEVIL